MTNQHPITPPPELVEQWAKHILTPEEGNLALDLDWFATKAAQWGADHELEACVEWLDQNCNHCCELLADLRAARRPKPQSLKEQALTALHAVATGANDTHEQHQDLDTIRKALEQLNDE